MMLTAGLVTIGYLANVERAYRGEQVAIRQLVATEKFDPIYPDGKLVPGFIKNPDC